MERLLWWVLAGSRGGPSRARLMAALRERPYNANQLAERLSMDYKTVRHHLEVLEKNTIVVTQGSRYARLYYLSKNMDGHYELFDTICQGLGLETEATQGAGSCSPSRGSVDGKLVKSESDPDHAGPSAPPPPPVLHTPAPVTPPPEAVIHPPGTISQPTNTKERRHHD